VNIENENSKSKTSKDVEEKSFKEFLKNFKLQNNRPIIHDSLF
jgi:hypothetical protein